MLVRLASLDYSACILYSFIASNPTQMYNTFTKTRPYIGMFIHFYIWLYESHLTKLVNSLKFWYIADK